MYNTMLLKKKFFHPFLKAEKLTSDAKLSQFSSSTTFDAIFRKALKPNFGRLYIHTDVGPPAFPHSAGKLNYPILRVLRRRPLVGDGSRRTEASDREGI